MNSFNSCKPTVKQRDRVFIVLSSPRSGSSWTARNLKRVPNFHVYSHVTFQSFLLYLLYPVSSLNPFGDDTHHGESVLDAARARLLRSLFKLDPGKDTLVLSSPTFGPFLPILKKAYPSAKYVYLRRNTLDTVASYRTFLTTTAGRNISRFHKVFKSRGLGSAFFLWVAHGFHRMRWSRFPYGGYIFTRPAGFQAAVKQDLLKFLSWYYSAIEKQIETGLEDIPAENNLLVSYDSLVTNFEAEASRLLQFMGARELQRVIKEAGARVRRSGVSRYERDFTPEELAFLKTQLRLSVKDAASNLEPFSLTRTY